MHHREQRAQHASAPQTNDLDRGRQAAYPTVLLPTQSAANSPRSSSSSLIPDAPLFKQKRASRSAQRSLTPSLNSIPNLTSSSSRGSSTVASSKSDSSSKSPRGSSLCDSQPATDSSHKHLRPKSSYHQSLLDLRDEVQKKTESGMYLTLSCSLRLLISIARSPMMTAPSYSPPCARNGISRGL
jgi:hypothetical protein